MSGMEEEEEVVDLPPGFRFYPTDEELVTHYLTRKAMDARFTSTAIRDVDLYKSEPWELPCKEEGYFFCVRDSKYPSGLRSNRATPAGYWKSTGKDKAVCRGGVVVGKKKTLVFYGGRAPRGEKTSWVMHEYTMAQRSTCPNFLKSGAQGEWVICRVFVKKHQTDRIESEHDQEAVNGCKGKMEETSQMKNRLSIALCIKGAGKEEHMLHEGLLMNNPSYVSPSLLLHNQQGTYSSTMHIIGASQETGLTSNEMNKNNPEVSSVGSLHLDEPSWNF